MGLQQYIDTDMPKDSKSALYAFLFHLRTPLAGIRTIAAVIDKLAGTDIPIEAREWFRKWLPKVDLWLNSAIQLTELLGKSESQDQGWKALIQQLLTTLDGVEVAADEAKKIPYSEVIAFGDLLHSIISSIEHISDDYKVMKELLPTLD